MYRKIVQLIQIVALLGTWLILFFLLHLFTEFVLVPWDTAVVLPPVGSVERTLNDFFQYGIGQFLLGGLFVLLNLRTVIHTIRRGQWRVPRLIFDNLLLILILPLIFVVITPLNNALFSIASLPYDEVTYHGYHRSMLPIIGTLIPAALWVNTQIEFSRELRKRKQHAAADAAHSRLTADDHYTRMRLSEAAEDNSPAGSVATGSSASR